MTGCGIVIPLERSIRLGEGIEMLRYISCTVCCTAFFTMTSVAEAQILRIGPFGGVRVRAPFVSVDVLPNGGGTRVRAPFTAVNTGPVGYPYAVPGYPTLPGYPVLPALPALPTPFYPVPAYPKRWICLSATRRLPGGKTLGVRPSV